jgi:hypothetical protein
MEATDLEVVAAEVVGMATTAEEVVAVMGTMAEMVAMVGAAEEVVVAAVRVVLLGHRVRLRPLAPAPWR